MERCESEESSGLVGLVVSAQRFAVPHVLSTLSAQVGPLHQQVGQPVQANTDGEGGDEAVETPQHNAQGPAQNQQHQQPYDGPETRATRHPQLQREKELFQTHCRNFTEQHCSPEKQSDFN